METYIVYLPDGSRITETTTEARGDWAIANIRETNDGWVVTGIFDKEVLHRRGPVITVAERRGPLVATAERIGEKV